MLEPRRVAARAAAGFMAQQLGEAVGETVGYRIRFESKVSARTRIEVVTEGILTRMLQDDPTLEGVGALLFDEFHERHLAGDLGLALALDVQAALREDLRIVVMSATLDGERLARFLDAPRLSSAGRSFPVEVAHFPARRDEVAGSAGAARGRTRAGDASRRRAGVPARASARSRARRSASCCERTDASQCRTRAGRRACLRAARRTAGRTAVARAAARPRRPSPRGAGDQRRRIQRDPARRARGHRQPAWRASRATTRTADSRGWTSSPSRRPRPTSAPAAPAASPTAGRTGCGRNRSDWNRSDAPEIAAGRTGGLRAGTGGLGQRCAAFRRSAAGRRARGRARPAAAPRRAGCDACDHAAGPPHARARHASAPGRDAVVRAATPTTNARWPAISPRWSKRAIRCARARDALAERWRALAAFRAGRAPPDAHRSALAAIDAAAKQWRRRLRIDARAAARRARACARRPARACLPRSHRPPACQRPAPLPARQRPHGEAVRRQRAGRRTLAGRQRIALRCARCADAARRAARRALPARAIRRALLRPRRNPLGCRAPRAGGRTRAAFRRHRARCASRRPRRSARRRRRR